MILKAGTYLLNNPLIIADTDNLNVDLNFTSKIVDTENGVDANISCTSIHIWGASVEGNVFEVPTVIYKGITSDVEISDDYVVDGQTFAYLGEFPLESLRTITLETDQTVDDYFGNAFILNSNYNEVNETEETPLATIEYNGETIAQLNAGDKATIPCSQYKMSKDLVFKVNEVESKIPEGYVKPEGTLNILRNNTTYDVSQYAEVRIATAHPYEVPLEMLMNNVISDASQATIGNVYKYTGETTDTYENGTLYILEEVSE